LLDWYTLIARAVTWGLGLSLVLVIIMITSGLLALDMWVGDYPPDIRRKYGPMSPRARRLRPFIAFLVFAAFLGIPFLGLWQTRAILGELSFVPALAFSFLGLLVFNTFDLIILDWLVFCTIQPPVTVLPGTAGMAGYRNYRFHFIGFIKGLGFCAAGSAVIAAAWILSQSFPR
jgi:hypothetical protein